MKKSGIVKKIRSYWHILGPGLTTGAADDDPAGITTYSQTGAQFGYQLTWLSLFTFPLMGVVQEMCARIGLVTGRGLAANIKLHYPRILLYTCAILLFLANTINIGANLGAMAKATQLLLPSVDFTILILLFSSLTLILQIYVCYEKYAKVLKFLTFTLLAYVAVAFTVKLDWDQVIRSTLIPSFSFTKEYLFIICAIFGTTISPYLFFWQTSQEIEDEISHGKKTIKARQVTTPKDIWRMRLDVWSGMLLSNVIMFFIIIACAATLYQTGQTNIQTAADAANALKPIAGNAAYFLFTAGILGTGLLAIPVLAGSSSYAISESLGWKEGLHKKFYQAHSFYGVIILSTLLGLIINYIGLDPIQALLYSAVINGIVAPIMLVFIVLLSNNKKIMGKFSNGPITRTIGWITVAVMTFVALATIASFLG